MNESVASLRSWRLGEKKQFFECKVCGVRIEKKTGVSVQDMILRQPFLTPNSQNKDGLKSYVYVHKVTGKFSSPRQNQRPPPPDRQRKPLYGQILGKIGIFIETSGI